MAVPHIPSPVDRWIQAKLSGRAALMDGIVEAEGHGPGVSRENRKIHSLRAGESADTEWIAWFQTGLGGYS